MADEVDNFLAHYGVPGMKWGRRKSGSSTESKPKMSRKKKIAIAVGVGATVAIGAAVAVSIMNGKKANLPVQHIASNASAIKGKANLIFNAAAMPVNSVPKPKPGIRDRAKEKAFNKAKAIAIKKAQDTSYSDFKAMIDSGNNPRSGVIAKAKGVVMDKAKEVAINKVRDIATAKSEELVKAKSKR